jgi:hypothetical protein
MQCKASQECGRTALTYLMWGGMCELCDGAADSKDWGTRESFAVLLSSCVVTAFGILTP